MIRTDKVRVRDADLGSPVEAVEGAEKPLLVPKASPKKSRFWAFVVLLILAGAALSLVVLWQRDANIIDKALLRAEPFREAIEAAMGSTRQLPLALPRTALDGKPFSDKGFVYLPADTIRFLRDYDGPVLVGFASPCATALTPNGRVGVWCEKGRCTTRWMAHAEVTRQRKLQEEWVARRQEELIKAPPRLP